eukprot:586035-Alexandrium_andersonii.AAC.1
MLTGQGAPHSMASSILHNHSHAWRDMHPNSLGLHPSRPAARSGALWKSLRRSAGLMGSSWKGGAVWIHGMNLCTKPATCSCTRVLSTLPS